MKLHEGELDVDAELVRILIVDQSPRWADLPVLHVVPAGTVNATFRLGESLAVRLPLRDEDPRVIREVLGEELRELPEIDADVMCHGDLTPQNVLVDEAHSVGVLDTAASAPPIRPR